MGNQTGFISRQQNQASMSKQVQTVEIQGRSYRVNCPEGQEQALRQAASALNKRLNQLAVSLGTGGSDRLAIMAALNLTHELHQEQEKNRQYAQAMEQRLQLLQTTVEKALIQQSARQEESKDC